MGYEPWQMAAMEEYGYTTTGEGLINRVACCLAGSSGRTIDTGEFRRACIACDVDPDSFSQADWNKLQRKLNQIT